MMFENLEGPNLCFFFFFFLIIVVVIVGSMKYGSLSFLT
jgi:hypothetical protein